MLVGGGLREGVEAREGESVGALEDEHVSVDESEDLKEEVGVGGVGEREERHQRNELEGVDQSPHGLPGGLAE